VYFPAVDFQSLPEFSAATQRLLRHHSQTRRSDLGIATWYGVSLPSPPQRRIQSDHWFPTCRNTKSFVVAIASRKAPNLRNRVVAEFAGAGSNFRIRSVTTPRPRRSIQEPERSNARPAGGRATDNRGPHNY